MIPDKLDLGQVILDEILLSSLKVALLCQATVCV